MLPYFFLFSNLFLSHFGISWSPMVMTMPQPVSPSILQAVLRDFKCSFFPGSSVLRLTMVCPAPISGKSSLSCNKWRFLHTQTPMHGKLKCQELFPLPSSFPYAGMLCVRGLCEGAFIWRPVMQLRHRFGNFLKNQDCGAKISPNEIIVTAEADYVQAES